MGIPAPISPPMDIHGAGGAQPNWRNPSLGKASQCRSLHRYDRNKLTLKDIHNCQYVACMNPTAGSFTIDSRLQVCRTCRAGGCAPPGLLSWDRSPEWVGWGGGPHGAG